jgi:signal transduction histidine kinase
MRWCAFAIVTAVTGLLLAAAVAGQRRAQDALKRSHAELEQRVLERTRDLEAASAGLAHEMAEGRRLEAELIRVSEDQQQSLGRELHDGLGQLLTSVSLMSAALQQRLAEQALPEAATAQRISQLIAEASAMTRSAARGLYPVALEFGGLPAALQELAEQTRMLLNLGCHCSLDPQVQVRDPRAALNLYRVAQEAVANAVKYSQARQLRISLSQVDSRLQQLSISDDGLGIDPARRIQGTGLGMASMRFRANLLAGSLDVHRNELAGTTVTLTYPAEATPRDQQQHQQIH